MAIVGKLLKYLSCDTWYHATTLDRWNSICEKGVLAEYNKETSNDLDFGYGFYLTNSKGKSEDYIKRYINTGLLGNSQPIIIGFEFCPLCYFNEYKDFNAKILNAYDDEFALFVFKNRTENIGGSNQHKYDIIFGVMSDSQPTTIITNYKMGIITEKEAVEQLKKPTSMKQLSLHNQKLCDILKMKEAYILNIDTKERKELDINEYGNR